MNSKRFSDISFKFISKRMIPMSDSNASNVVAEGQHLEGYHVYSEEKAEIGVQNSPIHLCSTPPLPETVKEYLNPRKRSSCSPSHFSKKERILQSLMVSVQDKDIFPECKTATATLPTKNLARKRSKPQTVSEHEREATAVAEKRPCLENDMKENKMPTVRGKLTWILVGENGSILWKETANKEKIVSSWYILNFCAIITNKTAIIFGLENL